MCNKPLSTAAAMLGLRYSCGLLAIGRDIFWSALLSPICVFPPRDLCLTLRLALENHVFTFGNQKKSYSSQMICNGSFWHNSVFLSQINWNVSSYKGLNKFWQNCNLVSSYCELYLVICEPGFFTQFFSLLFGWVGIGFMPTEPFLQSFPCSLWQLVLGSLSGWTNVSWWRKPENKKCIYQVL